MLGGHTSIKASDSELDAGYPAGHMESAEMTQGVQKSKAMEREQTEECQLAHDQDWAGLLRVRALDGESGSWDLCSCFCRDQRSDDPT